MKTMRGVMKRMRTRTKWDEGGEEDGKQYTQDEGDGTWDEEVKRSSTFRTRMKVGNF
ncbi:hypothetical protein FACS189472_17240 [Alphaproteobacteria bacterium]|nr:hypothetical protein FACS189472_17240 [Alphaproteobacteria bacterium]